MRDFLYISDFCDGILCLLGRQDLSGKIFNIASGEAITVRNVIEKIIEKIGTGSANFGGKSYRNDENMELYADITAIKSATSWRPKVNIDVGLAQTIDAMNLIP